MRDYYTVVVPICPERFRTEWHPREADRGTPFETLTRGAWDNEESAIVWARLHLDGTPYSVRKVSHDNR